MSDENAPGPEQPLKTSLSLPARFEARLVIAIRYQLRVRRAAREIYGLSSDEFEILIAVAAATVGGLYYKGGFAEAEADQPVDIEELQPVSRLALANSTGLNRETVRRIVFKLIEAGWLVEHGRGINLKSGSLLREENIAFWTYAFAQLDHFSREYTASSEIPSA